MVKLEEISQEEITQLKRNIEDLGIKVEVCKI